MKVPRNKSIEKDHKTTLEELPYHNFTGNLALHLGRLNNSVASCSQSRRNLDKLSSLHNLDLFKLSSDFNTNLNAFMLTTTFLIDKFILGISPHIASRNHLTSYPIMKFKLVLKKLLKSLV